MQLTIKQYGFLIDRITARKQNEFANNMEMQAMLQGAKIKIPRINVVDTEQEDKSELDTKISDDQATALIQNALNRKKAGN